MDNVDFNNCITYRIFVFLLHLSVCDFIVYSFIAHISIAPLQVHYYSEALKYLPIMYCIALYIYIYTAHSLSFSEALPTTALILCRSQHAEALQATMCEGLAQDPYVVAGVEFEPATYRTQTPNVSLSRHTPYIISFCKLK